MAFRKQKKVNTKIKNMGDITVFWKSGKIIGTCSAGKESDWLNPEKLEREKPDRQTSSTDERWHQYARARAEKNNGGGGMSESDAQRCL